MSSKAKGIPVFLLLMAAFLTGIFMGCSNNQGISGASSPPEVTSTNPEDSADSTSVTSSVRAAFSQPMDEATINESTFIITSDADTLTGTVSTNDTTAVLTLRDSLSYGTRYVASLSSNIEDEAGESLPGKYQWDFTTEEQESNPDDGGDGGSGDDQEDDNGEDEGDDDQDDGNNEGDGTGDDSDNGGDDGNNGDEDENDGDGSGEEDDSDDGNNGEDDDGSDEDGDANGQDEGNGGNQDDNSDEGDNNGEGQDDENNEGDGEDDGDGEEDNDRPVVVSSDPPESGSDGISVDTNIEVTFSEEVDPTTVELALYNPGTERTYQGSIDIAENILTYSPDSSLTYRSDFQFVISEAEDLSGNALRPEYTMSFSTEEPPVTTPPTVEATSPGNGDNRVSVNSEITVTFSADIDPYSVNDNTVTLEGPDGEVPVTARSPDNTITISPDNALEAGSSYTYTISGVRDVYNNRFEGEFSATFTTEENQIAGN